MKKALFITVFLVAAITIPAQKAMTFAIPFASGSMNYILDKNPWGAGTPSSTEIVNGRFYRYVHFSSVPNYSEREVLEQAGVKVLFFEHGTTYVASIAAATTFPLSINSKLLAVSDIAPKTKMLPELSIGIGAGVYPSYAIDEKGNVGIIFTYYADIPHEAVMKELSDRNLLVTYSNANSHRVIVWVAPNSAEAFCALPFVCAAELNDDIPQPDNLPGRTNHREQWLAQEFSWGRQYNGTGVAVALQDDGIIGPHIDYTGRITQFLTANGGNHGDHCAGIIMGAGNLDPYARGMGWGADIYVYGAVPYTGWDSIYSHYYSNSIRVISTSYSDGCNAGYTTRAQELDQQAMDMPELINVFSAGNNGGVDCSYGAGSAYGNVTGGHKHSKNSIAVGNLDYIDNLASSSSCGPVHDGRMKPEVCAVGSSVYSTVDVNDYEFKSGTSMSCPAVSGTFSQMGQAYRDIYGTTAKSGLLKAILMNTCDDLENPGPDFRTGYGRINGRRVLQPLENGQFLTDSIDDQQMNTHNITVPSGVGQLRVMIYWHDVPAAVNAGVALVNNIDMTVTTPSSAVLQPWVLNFTPTVAALSANAVPGQDIRNNHEQMTLDNPAAGTYTITIDGENIPMGPQTYFVTWYFVPAGELVVTYPNGGEGLAPGEVQTVRWDMQVDTGTVDIEYTADNGLTWLNVMSNVNAAQHYTNWTVPAQLSGQCRVRVMNGTSMDTSDADFTIAPVPANIVVAWACTDSLCLKWDTVPGGTGYDVFMLGAMYMDSVGTSASDSLVVTGLNNLTNTYWFSVRTRAPLNAVGRRAIAIEKTPGVFCPGQYDASATAVSSPLMNYFGCMTLTNVPVIATITNPGITAISNFPVSFSYDNGTPVNETFTGTIAGGASATYTFTATVNIGSAGNHTLETWTSYPSDAVTSNDTFVYNVNHISGGTVVPPYSETFETFALCGTSSNCEAQNCTMINNWYNIPNGAGDDIDWRTNQGNTPTTTSGPSTDYVPGTTTGNYLYTEASNCFYKTAELISPCIDLTTFANPTLLFGYHMLGSDMGSLHIDIYANGVWNNDIYVRNGSQSQNWLQASISLTAYQGQVIIIRFRGITGGGGASDISIDAMRVEDVTSTPEYTFGSTLNVYPNPANGIFNFSMDGLNNEVVTSRVYDITGRMIMSNTYGEKYGTFTSAIDLSAFESGTYFLEISVGEATYTTRLVKEE